MKARSSFILSPEMGVSIPLNPFCFQTDSDRMRKGRSRTRSGKTAPGSIPPDRDRLCLWILLHTYIVSKVTSPPPIATMGSSVSRRARRLPTAAKSTPRNAPSLAGSPHPIVPDAARQSNSPPPALISGESSQKFMSNTLGQEAEGQPIGKSQSGFSGDKDESQPLSSFPLIVT